MLPNHLTPTMGPLVSHRAFRATAPHPHRDPSPRNSQVRSPNWPQNPRRRWHLAVFLEHHLPSYQTRLGDFHCPTIAAVVATQYQAIHLSGDLLTKAYSGIPLYLHQAHADRPTYPSSETRVGRLSRFNQPFDTFTLLSLPLPLLSGTPRLQGTHRRVERTHWQLGCRSRAPRASLAVGTPVLAKNAADLHRTVGSVPPLGCFQAWSVVEP
ncbi:hypothetical protein GQ53DRAFT_370773 [Thozetella sp. PMI_491]|nr:hypothetical protein GQ53DRAFT_370773 [Thozetella sp. PMI_491]